MTRVVGRHDRSPFILDPAKAVEVGRRLDALLSAARLPHPRGVLRGTHAFFDKFERRRMSEAALGVAVDDRPDEGS
jgi:hypothetical protein